ncbi:MAG: hypothetical protein KDK10_07005 [Maritimibacter sp.]|nr:hypothetical protein [Maritimibacter sp.]
MPIVLALLGILTAAAFWIYRIRGAAQAAEELADVANDVRLAARRFGFKRRSGQNAIDSIDEPQVAVAAIAVAFLELDELPTRDQQIALGRGLQHELRVSLGDAEELMILGRWLMKECGSAEQAVTRLGRRLYKLDPKASFQPLMGVVKEVASAGAGLSAKQNQALDDLRRAFRIT